MSAAVIAREPVDDVSDNVDVALDIAALAGITLGRIVQAVSDHAPAAFSCSFGLEDMVILDLLAQASVPVEVFTLDTGRLHPETHELMARARKRYGLQLRVLSPQADAVEELVARDGRNGFYDSLQARKACCDVRKVQPLNRALQDRKLWITGLRSGQAATRSQVLLLEHDEARDLWKFNPLADWTADRVRDYIDRYAVPVNALHARGYPSIGCAPCTRAVAPGEDERAGRWWWESPQHKECGLHISPDGRVVRAAR